MRVHCSAYLTFIFGILLLVVFPNVVSAQCMVDAGRDTSVCQGDEIQLDIPLVTGGVPPYSYIWQGRYHAGTQIYHASFFLDDTTAANPTLETGTRDTLLLVVTVTDDVGSTCSDTVEIGFCWYLYHADDPKAYIRQGDSTQLYPGAWGNCEPLLYHWEPNYNISDQNIGNPLVWPDTSVVYYATVVDSAGCTSGAGDFEIYVTPIGIDPTVSIPELIVHPNPNNGRFQVQVSSTYSDYTSLIIRNTLGQVVFETSNSGNVLGVSELVGSPSGLYFLEVWRQDKRLGYTRFIKQLSE